jgi:hypothetical protein
MDRIESGWGLETEDDGALREMKFDCKKWYARCSGSTEREERVVEGK